MGLGALQPAHLIVILVIVLLIFGPGKLPELGRAMGDGLRELKKATGKDLAMPILHLSHLVDSASEYPTIDKSICILTTFERHAPPSLHRVVESSWPCSDHNFRFHHSPGSQPLDKAERQPRRMSVRSRAETWRTFERTTTGIKELSV